MKTVLYGLVLAALCAAGCIPKAPFTWPDDGATSASAAGAPRQHVPAVRAEQVTAENAPEKARALEAELEGDRETAPK